MKTADMVKETVESGIVPIVLDFEEIRFFDKGDKVAYRSFLRINSLDVGVLTYREYRYVARRTKQGNHLVSRHLEKLFRVIPTLLEASPNVECFTVPVYARLLFGGELAGMIIDTLALFPSVPVSKVCIELSADILYENIEEAKERIEELRALGVKVAILEVGDEFCPVFRLAELPFDYAFIDEFSTATLDREDSDRVAGSLVNYLHYLSVKVIAPGLDSEDKIAGAKRVGCDGYTIALKSAEPEIAPVSEAEEEVSVDESV